MDFVRDYLSEPVPEPIWILLKQETVSGSSISWDVCKSASHPRQLLSLMCLWISCWFQHSIYVYVYYVYYLCLLTFPVYFLFSYFVHFLTYLLLSRIGLLHFQAGHCRRRPNLVLVYCVIVSGALLIVLYCEWGHCVHHVDHRPSAGCHRNTWSLSYQPHLGVPHQLFFIWRSLLWTLCLACL